MKAVCKDLDKGNLNKALGSRLVSQQTRDFARAFVDLQEARQNADYDPTFEFTGRTVLDLIVSTQGAFAAFDRIPPDEQADILALMMVKART